MSKRVLFICKKNETYGFTSYTRRSSGLYNSTRFIAEAMAARGIHTHIVEVQDNNAIHREVVDFKADVVVIEALWVVPSKFIELKRVMPNVKWMVHLHSHIPFLALEGIAMEWLYGCAELGVDFIANSKPSYDALRTIFPKDYGLPGVMGKLHFLPNIYLMQAPHHDDYEEWNAFNKAMRKIGDTFETPFVNIGCFGAVRPLKNQLLQAMAAIEFSRQIGKKLKFHLNVSRTETGGQPVLKNILELFKQNPDAEIVQHEWHEPNKFIETCAFNLDIGMQVSLTETFNVVTADYVTAGVPIVVSKEVSWASRFSQAKDDAVNDIVMKLHRAYHNHVLVDWNQHLLRKNSNLAQNMWFTFLKNLP